MGLILLLFLLIIYLVPIGVAVLTLIEQWKVFKKAGKEGWEAIIPIYNNVVLIEITGLPMWYIALLFVPFANIYATIRIFLELAYRFNKDTGFGIGLAFLTPIFLGILAFKDDCVYSKPIDNLSSFCPKCGSRVTSQDKFCTSCGNSLISKDSCMNCGNKIEKNDKFCKKCGTKI